MNINLHDYENAENEKLFLGEVLAMILRHQHVVSVDVYINKRATDNHRNPLGWIEYLTVLSYDDGGKLTVGCLQRSLGATTEFHT